ncbi:hypothetical protein ACFXG4_18825 [Nocardia sp. NPDC059246]|uniref:hypothetical protein n=1 Tax=unclassified Nocardia TaxID=2637762 RepID=UPI0036BCF7C6
MRTLILAGAVAGILLAGTGQAAAAPLPLNDPAGTPSASDTAASGSGTTGSANTLSGGSWVGVPGGSGSAELLTIFPTGSADLAAGNVYGAFVDAVNTINCVMLGCWDGPRHG